MMLKILMPSVPFFFQIKALTRGFFFKLILLSFFFFSSSLLHAASPEEGGRLLQDYRETLRQEKHLRLYNDLVEKMIASQEKEIASFEEKLSEIETTHQEILPLMIRMIDRLEQFIALDRPFLVNERKARVENLRKRSESAALSLAEKYRRVLEVYRLEMAYGRTMETRTGLLSPDGKMVHFLRLGRLALFYLSLDGKEGGYWDARAKNWKKLPEDELSSLERGLLMARKEAPPDLLVLPISASEISE